MPSSACCRLSSRSTGPASLMRYSLRACVCAKIASVIFSGAGPPFSMLYLMPKSPSGPPGLWLAESTMPPKAPCLRITQLTAGVERMPPRPTNTFCHLVCGGHAQDGLDRGAVEVTAVAPEHEGAAAAIAQGQEYRLDEVFEVAGLLELGHLLAQTRGAGTLPGKRRGRYCLNRHLALPYRCMVCCQTFMIRQEPKWWRSLVACYFSALSVTNSVNTAASTMQAPPSARVSTVWPPKKCLVKKPSSRPLTICGITTKKLNRPM
jgi:hypothetical protein